MNERCNLGDTDLKLTLRLELKITRKRNVVIKSKFCNESSNEKEPAGASEPM